ncbi:MAG: hypothetical protein AAB383_01670 [Patescibacteria group bacterium]
MRNRRASALLLSFFMMTMLILVSISVSVLVIRDIAAVRTIVGGTQALYGAEGMSEIGLYAVKENLPGYEPSYSDYVYTNSVLASANLHAREDMVPCLGQDSDGWSVLAPNESIQLALFAQTNEGGDFLKNTSFAVDFYVGDDEGKSLYGVMSNFLNSEDILRWKILGLYNEKTEAISEYIPLDTDNARTSKVNPSVFGPGSKGAPKYMNAKFYDSGTPSHFYPDYPISTFLADHDYSYLVLTNIIQGIDDANIYYRLRWTSGSSSVNTELDEVVCEYTEISSVADVENGSARQLLKTLVREGENLPVFDFVLYHTADDDAEKNFPGVGGKITNFPFAELFNPLPSLE